MESGLSNICGSRSTTVNTLRAAASPRCSWLIRIPKINSGIVILVLISKKVTSSPVVISPSPASEPPTETNKPNAIPAMA